MAPIESSMARKLPVYSNFIRREPSSSFTDNTIPRRAGEYSKTSPGRAFLHVIGVFAHYARGDDFCVVYYKRVAGAEIFGYIRKNAVRDRAALAVEHEQARAVALFYRSLRYELGRQVVIIGIEPCEVGKGWHI